MTAEVSTVVQICPQIAPGTGVGGVAHHLEREFQSLGVTTQRVTLTEVHGAWTLRLGGRLGTVVRVVWFSTIGTLVARAKLHRMPGALSICHNDALAGDIYVNHGVVRAAMHARGHGAVRMVRNPLHLFTTARDTYRYRSSSVHRVVVNLCRQGEAELRDSYGRVRLRQATIGNGVDLDRFRVPAATAREASRSRAGLGPADFAVLFVGHEFGRKGLPTLLEAMTRLPDTAHLFVVGGTAAMVERQREDPTARRLGERLRFVGAGDPAPWFEIADAFALPSAYEAYPLVVLEALASGVPVVATPTGCVPDVVSDGVNGFVVPADPRDLALALSRIEAGDRGAMAGAARAEAERHSWESVAREYLALLGELHGSEACVG